MSGARRGRRRIAVATGAALALLAVLTVYAAWQGAMSGADAPSFRLILIKPGNYFAEEEQEAKDAGGKVPPEAIDLTADQYDLPLAEVKKNPTGSAFLALLRRVPALPPADQAIVFRVRDGMPITAEGGDALADGNQSAFVVPADIVMLFDSPRDAYLQLRLRTSGLIP